MELQREVDALKVSLEKQVERLHGTAYILSVVLD